MERQRPTSVTCSAAPAAYACISVPPASATPGARGGRGGSGQRGRGGRGGSGQQGRGGSIGIISTIISKKARKAYSVEEENSKRGFACKVAAESRDKIKSSSSPLEVVLDHQASSGSFRWSAELATALGCSAAAGMPAKPGAVPCSEAVWATALVVAGLERQFPAERDLWELVARKASKWVRAQLLRAEGAEEQVRAAAEEAMAQAVLV